MLLVNEPVIEFVPDDIFAERARAQAELVAEHIVLPVPDEQPFSRGSFPPEGRLLAAQREHAVVGMDATEQMLDAVLKQASGVAPAVSVNVRGHGIINGMADGSRIGRVFAMNMAQQPIVGQLRHIQVGPGDLDMAAAHRFRELLPLFRRGALQEPLNGPERLACPAEAVIFRAAAILGLGNDAKRLADKIDVILFNFLLSVRIPDIGMRMMDGADGPCPLRRRRVCLLNLSAQIYHPFPVV